ncbi:MAG: ComEC/Rec2 family competence protein, partial [Clostridia bacterium]|nr:ComEC/Rec2 family competence protein [Clostridia bacterium]
TLAIYTLFVPKAQRNKRIIILVAKVLLCTAVFISGALLYQHHETSLSSKAITFAQENPPFLTGIVVSDVHTYEDTQYFYLKAENGLKIYVKVRSQTPLFPGQKITLADPTLTPINPANTQIRTTRKLMGNGAFLSATFPYEATVTVNGVSDWLLYGGKLLRNATTDCFARYFPPKTASFLTALISSDQSGMPDELYQDFIATGTIHIVVVSGMHFNYLMGALLWLLSFFFPSRRGRLTASVLLLVLYVGYTGATLPVLRSFLMLSATFLCDLFYWKKTSQSLTLAGMVSLFLLFSPTLIYNPSFLLSFGAALGLTLFAQPLENYLEVIPWKGLRSYLATYLGVQVFTLPVILFYFARFPLVSVLTNFLVGPLVAPILLLCAITLAISRIPLISQGILFLTGILSNLFLWLVSQTAKVPLLLRVPLQEETFLLLLECGAFLAFSMRRTGRIRKNLHRFLCVTCLVAAMFCRSGFYFEGRILITFFGASNTNSAAITTERNRLVLYASGNDLMYGQSSAAYQDYSQIELLILTDVSNPEYLQEFLQTYKVKEVVIPQKYHSQLPASPQIHFLEQAVSTEADGIVISFHTDGETLLETEFSYRGQRLSFTQNVSYFKEHFSDDPGKTWIFNFRRTSQAAQQIADISHRGKLFSKKLWHPEVHLCNNYSMIQADQSGIYPHGSAEQEP